MNIILLSGGSGKRLWPLSNDALSKQFLPLLENAGGMESMVQRVVRQIGESGLNADITIAGNAAQEDIIAKQLGRDVNTVLEPERRDTFPAIALSCIYLSLEKKCPDEEVVLVMPCDPYTGTGYFRALGRMAGAVGDDAAELVLMGIRPTCPSVKFGYVVPEKGEGEVRKVSRFVEKPSSPIAGQLLEQGAFWNGGVFGFRLGYLMNIVRKYLKVSSFKEAVARYGELPKISFDYEVAEKAANVAVVPFDGEWKDLGTWNTLTEEIKCNTIGNALQGSACKGVHIINELGIPVFVDGLEDAVVVATPNGILVCAKKDAENLKQYVDSLRKR